MKMGKVISNLRKERGYSQQKVADMCGLSQGTISAIELGNRNLSASSLDKLAECFGVKKSFLLQDCDVNMDVRIVELAEYLTLNPRQLELLKMTKFLPDDKLQVVISVANALSEQHEC